MAATTILTIIATDATDAVREAFSKLTPLKQFQPKTHDYTVRGWGHDFIISRVIDGGQRLRLSG